MTARKRKAKNYPVMTSTIQGKGRPWRVECFIDWPKLMKLVGKKAIDAKSHKTTLVFGSIKITAREVTEL